MTNKIITDAQIEQIKEGLPNCVVYDIYAHE